MAASKDRPRWNDLPGPVRARIARLAGGPVVAAANCEGGFSPGLAARLHLADGRRVFVKAMDCAAFPFQADIYRDEARVAAVLPAGVPAPAFLGCDDDGGWVILAFECVDGAEPVRPWREPDLARVIEAAREMAAAAPAGPIALPDRPLRLGGWARLAADDSRLARLAACAPWAAAELPALLALERDGIAAARGSSLVHFDMYAHNILLTPDRVMFIDWPHARLGAPHVDVVLLLSSAVGDGVDPEPFVRAAPQTGAVDRRAIDGLLAAHAGFCLAGGLGPAEPGLEPIRAAKQELGLAALAWLGRRLG